MFLDLLDRDPLVRGTDRNQAPDPSRKNNKENFDSYYFETIYAFHL
jgi:hypothetical protein